MNGLSESEELELLQLQKAKAQAQDTSMNQVVQQAPEIAKQAIQAANPAELTRKFFGTDPATMQRVAGPALPIVGGALGGPIGASGGEFLRQATGTLLAPDTVPQTPLGRAASVVTAGVVQDPKILGAIPGASAAGQDISDFLQSIKPGAKKVIAKVIGSGMMSNKGTVKAARLINDPLAPLPESLGGSKSVEDATQQYADQLEKTPVKYPMGEEASRGLAKKEFSPFSRGASEADETAQSIWDKWKAGQTIEAQEAFDAKRATDKLWPTVVKDRNVEQIQQLADFKTAMDDVLSDQAGPFAKASKDYARARLGADFSQILPRTKTGDISTVKTLLLHTLAPGRTASMLAGGLTSPIVTAAGNLGVQGAMKAFNAIGNNPSARQALIGLLQQLREKSNTTSNP